MAKVILSESPSYALTNPSMHVALSTLYLAGSLRQAGHEVKVVDCHRVTSWDRENKKLIIHQELLEECDILGISCLTPNYVWGSQLAEAWPAKIKVAGGYHVSEILHSRHERFKRRKYFQGFDFLMHGECEVAFTQFCGSALGQVDYSTPGLAWFNEDDSISSNPLPNLPDVASIAPPAFDLWEGSFSTGGMTVHSTSSGKFLDDGRKVGSLFTARGCLPAGTLISQADGRNVPIENLRKGDIVRCFNIASKLYSSAPIKGTWVRDANDLWELEFDDKSSIRITSEHPAWTRRGWVPVAELRDEDYLLSGVREGGSQTSEPKTEDVLRFPLFQCLEKEEVSCSKCKDYSCLPAMLPTLQNVPKQSNVIQREETSKVLCQEVLSRMEEGSPGNSSDVWGGSFGEGAGKQSATLERGERQALESSSGSRRKSKKNTIGDETREFEPDEEARGSEGCVRYNEVPPFQENITGAVGSVERWKDAFTVATSELRCFPEQVGIGASVNPRYVAADIQVRGRRNILGGSLLIREKEKSRLREYQGQKDHTLTRRVLAHRGRCGDSGSRLHGSGLESSHGVGQRVKNKKSGEAINQDSYVWRKITARRFLGPARVYNITVHPFHNYFANGFLVHNCPYGCYFCADARTKLREETIPRIEGEVSQLTGFGVGAARLWDDVLTIKDQRCRQIADVLYDHGMLWRGSTRVNLRNPDLFRYMAQKGCTELAFGVEHGSARMLKAMNKGTTPEANEVGIKMAQDAGIMARAYLIIGFPGETQESIQELWEWLDKVRPDVASLHFFQPFPGSAVWNDPERFGVTIPEDAFPRMWEFEIGGDDNPENFVLDLPTISKEELMQSRKELKKWITENIGGRDR